MSTRGGSADRTIAARSAAAAKGWESRKRQAKARADAAANAPAPGSQQDRVLTGIAISALISRTIGALRERESLP